MPKKQNIVWSVVGVLFLFDLCAMPVSANSSWHWISQSRPYDVLPWVMLGTLLIEIISIQKIGQVHSKIKTILVVLLGNLISFLLPYAIFAIPSYDGSPHSWHHIEKQPVYTVSIFYLILTLLAELPIVYFLLRSNTRKKHRLFLTIVLSNIITTIGVAIIERIFCYGTW